MRATTLHLLFFTLFCLVSTTLACKACIEEMTEARRLCLEEGVSTGCPKTLQTFKFCSTYRGGCTRQACKHMVDYWSYIVKRFKNGDSDPANMCECGIPYICHNCDYS
ncbi:hypothetical protein L596_016843 [Steinernema carpocapsae]|uniref:Saposin B-type domain-containing protein n=1 Tax=Steinernema carpocapsae TaxID=34508 RepID=A0A4U5NJ96_STECR|nr:hypothetical protein L596_016843 [Steinernema carpocapsae]